MNSADEEFFYTIERNLASLDRLREAMVAYFNKAGLEENILSIVELCCYEAVANIIEHSKPVRDNNNIHIFCSVDDRRVACQIIHYGPEFDLTKSPLPDIVQHFTEGKNHGLGVYMIRTLMSEVVFSHIHERNSLTLIKKI